MCACMKKFDISVQAEDNTLDTSGEAKDKFSSVQASLGDMKEGGTAFCYLSKCAGLDCWCCSQDHDCSPVKEDCMHSCVFKN